jgi:pyridoxine 5'-phosphate synthase PdxJ
MPFGLGQQTLADDYALMTHQEEQTLENIIEYCQDRVNIEKTYVNSMEKLAKKSFANKDNPYKKTLVNSFLELGAHSNSLSAAHSQLKDVFGSMLQTLQTQYV